MRCRSILALTHLTAASSSVSLVHSLVKVRPDEPVPTDAVVDTVSAAQNEYESVQVVVAASEATTVTDLQVSLAGLSQESVLVHRARYINITAVSDCDGALGRWPDALVPVTDPYFNETRNALPCAVPAATNQVFWVDVFVPPGTAPGMHNGSVVVRFAGDGVEDATLALALRVRNFSLPATSRRYRTTYNCPSNNILAGRYLNHVPGNNTPEELASFQRQYVDLGLMHRVTFSDFLSASRFPLQETPTDWERVESAWGKYLGVDGQSVDTPFGLRGTRPTTIQLPAQHYPGPPIGGVNHSLIDGLWHATGCPKQTPDWGYAFWGSRSDYGVADMVVYCQHSAAGDDDGWARACGAKKGARPAQPAQPAPRAQA
jgi:hypothetical protein